MPRREETQHSVLIVSSSEQFNAIVRNSLKGFMAVDSRKNAAMARRCILERYYDMVIINAPLPDEFGEEYALDVTEKCSASVLVAVPREACGDVLERVTDHGIVVVPKPFSRERMDRAIRFLAAMQDRIHRLEREVSAAREKMEELRVVGRAKLLLVERKHMTEEEAHRYIGKLAMDNGVSRGRAAGRILEDME